MVSPANYALQMNTALFIDFDNIYITLEKQDKQAAEKFATSPDRWLGWLDGQLSLNYPGSSFTSRRILMRRCYLNPNSFSEHRLNFIRAACEVIDCPPLTSHGKTSTDIHMVVDILDALVHPTYFHEFIILSGDADFTPVLLKLRKHARYTAVLSIGYSSLAYRASCDQLIKDSAFLDNALGINYQDQEPEEGRAGESIEADARLLRKMADRIHDEAALPSGIPANDLPAIYKKFPEFTRSQHWLGFRSLLRLTQAIVDQRDDLVIVEDEDAWFVARTIFANWLYSGEGTGKISQTVFGAKDIKSQVKNFIQTLVGMSPTPIALNVVAHSILQKFSNQVSGTNWLGAGTFKNLLLQLELDGLHLSSEGPGYLYDPAKHPVPEQGQQEVVVVKPSVQDVFWSEHPDLAPLAQKIHRLTDMPYLTPRNYAILFEEIAREVNERGYQMTRTSRTVRDQCLERGAPIARSHVNFVLTGLTYMGYGLGSHGPEGPEELGQKMVENTVKLCQTAQLELNEEEMEMIRRWLLSEIGKVSGNGP